MYPETFFTGEVVCLHSKEFWLKFVSCKARFSRFVNLFFGYLYKDMLLLTTYIFFCLFQMVCTSQAQNIWGQTAVLKKICSILLCHYPSLSLFLYIYIYIYIYIKDETYINIHIWRGIHFQSWGYRSYY